MFYLLSVSLCLEYMQQIFFFIFAKRCRCQCIEFLTKTFFFFVISNSLGIGFQLNCNLIAKKNCDTNNIFHDIKILIDDSIKWRNSCLIFISKKQKYFCLYAIVSLNYCIRKIPEIFYRNWILRFHIQSIILGKCKANDRCS